MFRQREDGLHMLFPRFKKGLTLLITITVFLAVTGLQISSSVSAQKKPVTIQMEMDHSDESLRILLKHSHKVVYAIQTTKNRIEVLYSEDVTIDPRTQQLDDPVLSRYELKGSRKLILYTGSGYRGYESFELRNPFRLVLDLQGTRPAQRPAKTQHPAESTGTIVVLDPGHGGIENGAIGPTGLREKDVTLDLARRLRSVLEERFSINVVLTRDEDRLLSLEERTAVANHNRADLFISIHLNASRRSAATGAETYYLASDATDDDARTVAALENRAFGTTDDSIPAKPAGEQNDLELLLWDLAQNQHLAASSLLAERVQLHLNDLAGTRDRGVRQAPFRVLMGATMPAILVEVGFISNIDEEQAFKGVGYRQRVVLAMAEAVNEFLDNLDRLSSPEQRGAGRVGSK
jgi:N-acetylmuramoyl-L-alanine amidase